MLWPLNSPCSICSELAWERQKTLFYFKEKKKIVLNTGKSTISKFFHQLLNKHLLKHLLSARQKDKHFSFFFFFFKIGTSVSKITLVNVLDVTDHLYLGKSNGQFPMFKLLFLSVEFTLFPSNTFFSRLLKHHSLLVFLLSPWTCLRCLICWLLILFKANC